MRRKQVNSQAPTNSTGFAEHSTGAEHSAHTHLELAAHEIPIPQKKAEKKTAGDSSDISWVIKFENGAVHRYTSEQVRHKFGIEDIQAGMKVFHKARGERGTVVISFLDNSADDELVLFAELRSENLRLAKQVELYRYPS